MPAFAAIKLNNGTTDLTFTPVNLGKDGVATFKDQSSGIPVGYPTLTSSVGDVSVQKLEGVVRVKIQLALPKIDSITAPGGTATTKTVVNTGRCHVEFILPVQGTLEDRTALAALASAALANADIKKTVLNLEHFY